MELDLKKKKLQSLWEKKRLLLWEDKKVTFLENLSKLFPEADDTFNDEKIDIDDDPPEITIPNTQTMFQELNNEKLPEGLKFFQEELTEAINLDFTHCKI